MGDLSEQLSLDGFGPEPVGQDRLFFAVLPDDRAADLASAVAAALSTVDRTSRIRREHLHVTLHHLGDHQGVPASVVQMAQRAAQAAAGSPCFEIGFDQIQRFDRHGRKAATVLTGQAGVAAVCAFQALLGAEMKRAGLGQWVDKNFTPHMTLLYSHRAAASQPTEPVTWVVRDLVLVHSYIGETRHEVLGRWLLQH